MFDLFSTIRLESERNHQSGSRSNPLQVCMLLAVLCIQGCSGRPGRIATPRVDAEDASQQALELYDKDSDGILNPEELKASPPLVNALPAYDSDHDGSLSEEELVTGMQSWQQRGIGVTALPFTVRMDGRPLQGAEVTLTPAPFLDDAIQSATGVSDENGAGSLSMAMENRPSNVPQHLPVVQPGLYLVEITHPTIQIPSVYNTATTLGLEAGIAGQNPAGVVWELHSKKK